MKNWMILVVALVAITAAVVCLTGCNGINATPAYQSQINFWADSSAEMDKRCQAGDTGACRLNSANCTAALAKFRDASLGRDVVKDANTAPAVK